ncbi:MAG: pyruvate formate lyase-activating protein [Clostridiales bacterium]|nr:pyruvate formate lyase-activating protein [Clostridiales bacterium]
MTDFDPVGRIHSIESFGTVDGPGIRFVVFFQGCPMRCLFCHNHDTWEVKGGEEKTVSQLLEEYEKNKPFYKNGGLTATGGEPLLQLGFLTELFEKCKRRGIHTCLDTSGAVCSKERKADYERLLKATDLVLLDIKHSDPKGYKDLTGMTPESNRLFLEYLAEFNTPFVLRHVIVPGITYNKKNLYALGRMVGSFNNLVGVEVLPYHNMGEKKYEALGKAYPLKGTKPLSKEDAAAARQIILKGINDEKSENL